MVASAARAHPGWSFIFVGPVTADTGDLGNLRNVHFLGPRRYRDLPCYLRGFDVATVPFIFHDVTLRARPVKFYEYLASGIPLVATRLPDFEAFADLVELVYAPHQFLEALENTIQQDSPVRQNARMQEARRHSWTERFH